MKNKSIINLDLPSNQRDAACVEFVNNRIDDMTQKKFLKVDGTNSMTGDLNLNNNKVINLETDYRDSKSAVNVDFVQEEIKDLRDLVTQKIRESQINNSGQKRDAFRYLMEDIDESSSENKISRFWVLLIFPILLIKLIKKLTNLNSCLKKAHPTSTGHASVLTYINFLSFEWFPRK